MDMTVSTNASWYVLDADDRVIDVCPEWDMASLSRGGGAGVMREQVIGQPLGKFVSGDTTRQLLAAQAQAVRLTGRARRVPYRCDAPDLLRRMEMLLQPLGDGKVRVEHVLLATQAIPGGFDVQAAPAGRSPRLWRCSMCLRLRQGGSDEWMTPETLPPGRVEVHYTVCPGCSRVS